MGYPTKQRVVGVLPEGEKQVWEEVARREGFNSLWAFVCWVVRQHIKEKNK
jgi:hypothetical protein